MRPSSNSGLNPIAAGSTPRPMTGAALENAKMRIAIGSLFLLSLAYAGLAQDTAQAPDLPVKVRTLTIVAGNLPEADRQRIVHSLQGGTYPPEELAERVRQNLRDQGYYYARAETPQLAAILETPPPRSAEVSIQVEPGARYYLGNIRFQGASLFPPDQLRRQFPTETGSLFNATAVGKGLERLRDLYVDKGYIDFGAIPKPQIDEARHVVDLTIGIDEGMPYNFGHLILDGIEPHAGAGKALLASWATLQGKPYNSQQLDGWLASNWPGGAPARNRVQVLSDPDSHLVNALLQFP